MTMQRIPVEDDDAHGVVFVPQSRPRGSVVVLSGSGGGIPEGYGRRLCESGLLAFALAYFGVDGLPSALEEVPVEIVERGFAVFRSRLGVEGSIGIVGSSKGAELALLAASLLPDQIGTAVAIAPSNVAWYGLGRSGLHPSWTWRGRSVPFLPSKPGVPTHSDAGMRIDGCYDLSLYNAHEIDATTIPVERCSGPILLLSGSDDHMWSSAAMAELIVRRLEERGGSAAVTNVVYPGAGHAFLHREFFANTDEHGRPIWDFGGTLEADEAAAKDAWPRIASFLARVED